MRLQKATAVTTLGMCFVALVACGGGGGGGKSPPTTSSPTVTTNPTGTPVPPSNNDVSLGLDVGELSFAAATASAATPPAQQVLLNFDNYFGNLVGDVFIQLNLSGAAVANGSSTAAKFTIDGQGNLRSDSLVSDQTIVNTGAGVATSSLGVRIPISAVAPAALGAGKFTGTATVRVCLGDSTCARELPGSPRTINVTYVVDPVASGAVDAPADAVLPRIQVANTAGNVVIRGQSLSGVTSVRFGDTAASSITVVSNTEVRAQVPALAAGTYPVVLNNGGVAFSGSVMVVAPITATAQVLSYPDPQPARATAAVFDDARQSLLVVLAGATSDANKVVRYTRTAAGDWTSAVFSVPKLNDLVLANDGSRLLAVTDDMVMELAPETLSAMRTVPAPASLGVGVRLRRVALANDGRAVITTSTRTTVSSLSINRSLSPSLLYSTVNGSFVTLNNASQLEPSALVATDDGSHIFVTRSLSGGPVLDYDSSNTVVGAKSLSIRHADDQPLAVDQNVTRVIAYDQLPDTTAVLDGNFQPLGKLAAADQAVFSTDAAVINRAGTRAVALSGTSFYFFDLTAMAVNGKAVGLGTPLSLKFSGASAIQTAISADGQVAFFANKNGVAVVPVTR